MLHYSVERVKVDMSHKKDIPTFILKEKDKMKNEHKVLLNDEQDIAKVMQIISDYLQAKSITYLVGELNLSQSIIYKYRNHPDKLKSAHFSTICKIYDCAVKDRKNN